MQTPGILVMAGGGEVPLNRLTEYAKTAEQIGLRSFLVTEGPMTDALAVAQHIASVTKPISSAPESPTSTHDIPRCWLAMRLRSTRWRPAVYCSDWAPATSD